ncbi:hypothetical protein BLEM_1300 [Bifidobacterium lemurum]|uniref:Beta-carotene 15,15'-monooxygenase n=1 Tax=Bifidobacterium lemurum TaxID=1603886 RepID=A0A261FS38_9BIFI|nr:DUF624 domain-containing protein [Bifidobacterium lemurum]OZG61763.1 hypothetical protein BLEM_1300 [Bifidobacterium lemurum]QOL34917.1 DUF624 domain-containing protein [Bifidobacterium lemurum]
MRFNINAPFWQFMNTLVRFTALNLVFLLTTIPMVTIGPALAALYSTLFAYNDHDDIRLVREYLKRFKREFKHGLISGLLLFLLAAAIVFGLAFWNAWDSNAAYGPLILLIIAAIVVVLIAEYLFPLQARFANPLKRQWQLAAMFPWRAFPCSLALLGVDTFALALAYFVPFIRVLAILFGFAWVAYAKSLLLLWGFKRYGGLGAVEQPTFVNAHD